MTFFVLVYKCSMTFSLRIDCTRLFPSLQPYATYVNHSYFYIIRTRLFTSLRTYAEWVCFPPSKTFFNAYMTLSVILFISVLTHVALSFLKKTVLRNNPEPHYYGYTLLIYSCLKMEYYDILFHSPTVFRLFLNFECIHFFTPAPFPKQVLPNFSSASPTPPSTTLL